MRPGWKMRFHFDLERHRPSPQARLSPPFPRVSPQGKGAEEAYWLVGRRSYQQAHPQTTGPATRVRIRHPWSEDRVTPSVPSPHSCPARQGGVVCPPPPILPSPHRASNTASACTRYPLIGARSWRRRGQGSFREVRLGLGQGTVPLSPGS